MDFVAVQNAINNLPQTFKRNDTTYQQLVDSLSAALSQMTVAADGTTSQLTFQNASGGWLDVWGNLLGIPRQLNEADVTYFTRISVTITGGAGPVQVMLDWIAVSWNITVIINENLPGLGYQIIFPPTLSNAQINLLLTGLAQVRPAGVPFTAAVTNIGTYLDTVDYFDATQVTGVYMGGGTTPVTLTIPSTSNNSPPLMPELYLTDPTLNPGLG